MENSAIETHKQETPPDPTPNPPQEPLPQNQNSNPLITTDENQNSTKENQNNTTNEKARRHRRGKNEVNERTYHCPDCDKCYLSGPALVIHRKTKHGYNTEADRKSRGRPKKDYQNENSGNNVLSKFENFLNNETRKPVSLDQTVNDKTITLNIIKENLDKIFKQCKNELFSNIEKIEDYNFYKLIMDNWEKESPELQTECYFDNSIRNKDKENCVNEKVNSLNIDGVCYLYLREFSKKTNKEYFWFMNKFIILFREFLNQTKKSVIKEEYKTENKKDYTQIYSPEGIAELCNDFFLDFMEPKKNFGLNQDELIELTQHFCYWLYHKQYTQNYLTLLQD